MISSSAPEQAPDPEGEALAALERSDQEGALRILMRAYGPALFRFCRRMVREDDLAEEAHQMTFVQAFESLERFSHRSSLRTWLYAIARNRCLDAAKMARRRQRRFVAVAEPPDGIDRRDLAADERLAARARARALERCLERLAPKVRAPILLRYHQELSYPEIARVCGARPATLQARVARAMPTLRRCLDGLGAAA